MNDDVVVSPDWLAANRADPCVHIVDVRDSWEYEGIGHLPGAVNVPFDSVRDDSDVDRGTLPGPAAFADLLSAAGIESADTLVAYDDTHGVFAARFCLTAIEYGHDDVRLLDGDFSAWKRTHEITTESPAIDPAAYEADPLEPTTSPLVGMAAVRRAVEDDAVLVDTRERDEFEEAHLPGAVRFDWRTVIDDETRRLKAPDRLEALFAEHGVTPDRDIVLYCNTARRISHTYLVLQALGFENVAFYEGSLTEWLANDGPVETGPAIIETRSG